MNLQPYLFGTHAFFFREGDAFTVPSAGTCGREAKPGATDTEWVSLGTVEEANDSLEATEIDVWKPLPGRKRLYDQLTNNEKLKMALTTSEIGPLAMETLYRSLKLTPASTQFNPLAGKPKKGWLKFQRYDQEDQLQLVMDVFVALKISGPLATGGDLVKASWEAVVLHSTLNTGLLTAST